MPSGTKPTMLTALGFPAELDRTYQRLRGQSGRPLDRVAASLLRTSAELVEELGPLIEAGIVRIHEGVVEVSPPAEVLRIVVAEQSVLAERAHRNLDRVAAAITLLSASGETSLLGDGDDTRPLDGEVAVAGDVYAAVRGLILRSRGDLLWLRPDQWRGSREERMAALVRHAVRSGRRSRAIYPIRAVQDAPDVLAARASSGEEIRVLPELVTRLLVVGDSHAVVPEPLGLADLPLSVVRQQGVVQAMALWFELLWDRAAVPALDAAEPPMDLRRFLLRQLAAGARDEQIARRLGISLRTVRRRVAALMSDLGADSRFQAGVEAVRRGWV